VTAETPIPARRIVVGGLDLETTGLEQAGGHRIIEVALSMHDLTTHELIGKFTTRINPQRSIDPKAQEVHGISFESLAGEPLWEAVAPKVEALLRRCDYVVAHNGEGFDMPFLYAELLRAGRGLPSVGLVDTMLQGRWATADGVVPSLKALCFACGVPYDTALAHGALYDTDVMMESFFSQLKKGFFQLPLTPYAFKAPTLKKDAKP
jgi:DNA polymerase-3 subunit epsilon